MKSLWTIAFYFVFVNFSDGQKRIKICENHLKVNIDYSKPGEIENSIKDTLLSKIDLIFEQRFNDSILVLVNNKVIVEKKIVTEEFLGVSKEYFSINYSKYSRPPEISIVLAKANDCISFHPIKGKRIAYISHIGAGWSVELSNIIREYK